MSILKNIDNSSVSDAYADYAHDTPLRGTKVDNKKLLENLV